MEFREIPRDMNSEEITVIVCLIRHLRNLSKYTFSNAKFFSNNVKNNFAARSVPQNGFFQLLWNQIG